MDRGESGKERGEWGGGGGVRERKGEQIREGTWSVARVGKDRRRGVGWREGGEKKCINGTCGRESIKSGWKGKDNRAVCV